MGRLKRNIGKCIIDNCPNECKTAKMCQKHYTRLKRNNTIELPVWYKHIGCKIDKCPNKHDGLGYCKYHYNMIVSNPKHTKNRIFFKGRSILLKKNPRKGICLNCGKTRRTQMHHEKYDESNPLMYTNEICIPCHTKETWKLNQIKTTKKGGLK